MIEIAIVIAATLFAVGIFWSDFVSWVKNRVESIKRTVSGILHGVKVFVKKIGEAAEEIAKYYSKDGTQWYETTETRKINGSEVPEEIRRRADYKREEELDVTNEFKMELLS